MPLLKVLTNKFINPFKSILFQCYYSHKKLSGSINSKKREHHIVVSLTSFPARFKFLHYSIKSIMNQSLKPDVILLVLTKEEIKDESELPSSVLNLKKHGLKIFFADSNLKPHNKYLYAMRLYPESLLITVDDDNIYDKNLIQDLYKSFLKYPASVSAKRVHKIA